MLFATSAMLVGCGDAEPEAATERRPPLVEAVAARAGTLPLTETVNGVVRARDQVTVRPEFAGRIVEVLVRSGDAVSRGQPLIRLDDAEPRERLNQATAGVRLARAAANEARARVAELEARVRRSRTLAQEALIAAQELEVQEAQLSALQASAELAEAQVEQALATVSERRAALERTVIRAPVTGRVGQRQAEIGMGVDPGTVLFVVGNLDQVMVEVPLTQRMLGRVEAGTPLTIEPDDGAPPIPATLSRASPFLDADSFTTIAEIDVDDHDGRLRPGMFVTARLRYGDSQRATLVPASAVWEDPATGRQGIFVVQDAGLPAPATIDDPATDEVVETTDAKTIVLRPVEVLATGGGTMGVDGVGDGDWVVILGQHMLAERARDEARRQDSAPGGPLTTRARVRASSWQRQMALQGLSREDLLAGFLDKQQRIAAVLGAEIPDSEDTVARALGVPNPAGPGATEAAPASGAEQP